MDMGMSVICLFLCESKYSTEYVTNRQMGCWTMGSVTIQTFSINLNIYWAKHLVVMGGELKR